VVQDLNRDPVLPWPDGCFDAAVVTVSVQYLTRPVEVFAEVGRVLRPGAPFVIAFSNRCFPSKAIAAWLERGPRGHAELVMEYFRLARAFAPARSFNISPGRGHDPMYVVLAPKLAG
jgi:SAM-dependent methyltransferase